MSETKQIRLVFVGGGHSHVLALLTIMQSPVIKQVKPNVTLISNHPNAWYSGMIPACCAGLYKEDEVQIDLTKLCKRLNITFLHGEATKIDHNVKKAYVRRTNIESENDNEVHDDDDEIEIDFDVLSIDVGSITSGSTDEQISQFAITTRPIAELVSKLEHAEKEFESVAPRVVVIGGGAAGCELAFAINQRHVQRYGNAQVVLLAGTSSSSSSSNDKASSNDTNTTTTSSSSSSSSSSTWWPFSASTASSSPSALASSPVSELRRLGGAGESLASTIATAMQHYKIRVLAARALTLDAQLVQARGHNINTNNANDDDGDDDTLNIPYDICVWATGAAPPPLLAASTLERCERGFLRVGKTLQCRSHDHIFAAGDCCTVDDSPQIRRAGVFAVRMAPTLAHNIVTSVARLHNAQTSRTYITYEAQQSYLALIMTGDKKAIFSKYGVATGPWWLNWKLKCKLDEDFVHLFK